jgi:RimJ/RimL family protein N-acetyltransferase
MIGQYCKLEALNVEAHGEALYEAFASDLDHSNWTYLPYGPFSGLDDFQDWLKKTCCNDDPFFHTIIDLQNEKAVGMASYLRIEPNVGVIEVGHIHFSPLMQKTPLSTEAMYLMMRRIFDELGYRRYEWKCDSLNAPSCNAAKRLGFIFEGIFRQCTMYKGRNRDTAWYSIIDSEWPGLKKAFECWLSPDNFDNQGRQLASLSSFKQ